MKQIIYVIIGTITLITFSIFTNHYLNVSARNVSNNIENIIIYSKNGNWDGSYDEYKICLKKWEKTQDIWAILIEHEEIDNINASMAKILKYIEMQDLIETQAESSNLKLLLEHIPELYILNIKNIL